MLSYPILLRSKFKKICSDFSEFSCSELHFHICWSSICHRDLKWIEMCDINGERKNLRASKLKTNYTLVYWHVRYSILDEKDKMWITSWVSKHKQVDFDFCLHKVVSLKPLKAIFCWSWVSNPQSVDVFLSYFHKPNSHRKSRILINFKHL